MWVWGDVADVNVNSGIYRPQCISVISIYIYNF
jgi:hypothetical protein